MGQLTNKTALVTGGSRGIGRSIVESLLAEGMKVVAVARREEPLAELKRDFPAVQTRSADVADPSCAAALLAEFQPDILVVNAGLTPFMAPIHELTWEQFGMVWENDVRSTFEFGKQALTLPMKPGSTVVIVSSGAAFAGGGSPMSGGYAGAKRMQWLMAQYFQSDVNALNLGIRFVSVLPKVIIGTTDLGDKAATTYAARAGLSKQAFLDRMGPTLTTEAVAQGVIDVLTKPEYSQGMTYAIAGNGIEAMS